MRAAASVLLCAAGLCVGGVLRDTLRRRVLVLDQLCLFLRQLRFRARLHQPLGTLLSECSRDSGYSLLTFLPDCASRRQSGTPLPTAWEQAAGAFLRTARLSRREGQMLVQLVPALCTADGQQLDALLEMYDARAAEAVQRAAQTDASLGGLCVRICGAAGLLLGIMIL